MKTALYPRLAWDGLRKNKRLFTPYLLTCICMVMMFYILSFLGSPETCALLPRGSNTTGKILNLGSFVIFVFSAIFLYYTNSFLVARAGTVRDHLRGHLALHGRPRRVQQRRGAAAQRVRRRKAAEGKLAARPCGSCDPRRGVLPCREHHQPA